MGGQYASRLRTFCGGVGGISVGLLLLGLSAAGAQIYVQPYDLSGFARTSQNDTSVGGVGSYATAYDNFVLGSDSTLTGLTFTGIYFHPGVVGTTTSFQVQFYTDNAGQPGSSIYSSLISGNGNEACDSSANPVCTYSVDVDFSAVGGTPYWLSIVSNSDFGPEWGWARGINGDDGSYQDFFSEHGALDGDLAFSLLAAKEVPEPSTWAMMLIGFAAVGAALRRNGLGLQPMPIR